MRLDELMWMIAYVVVYGGIGFLIYRYYKWLRKEFS